MSDDDQSPKSEPQTDAARPRHHWNWRTYATPRNIIGATLLVILLVTSVSFLVLSQNPGVKIDCSNLREQGVGESGEILAAQLTSDIAELDKQIAAVERKLAPKRDDLVALRERRADAVPETTSTTTSTTSTTTSTTVPETTVPPPTEAPAPATTGLEDDIVGADSEAATAEAEALAEETTDLLVDELDGQIQTIEAEISQLDEDLRRLTEEKNANENALARARAAAEGADDPSLYSPPPAPISLQPRDPVAFVNLGSDRDARRVQIVLETVSSATSDATGDAADADGSVRTDVAQLPEKPTFRVDAGQLRRSTGVEIRDSNIDVWARRLGPVVVLEVCITPDAELDAGRYTGDVYLVDPSINPVRIPLEVTAQSRLINYLYGLLVLSPVIAFTYIWVTARISAGENPWDREQFWKWTGQNFVLCFAVGFAAVWATLQVPFNNPTWGSSVLSAAAVVGVGLVASVTAMTAVAGKIRETPPPNDDGDPGGPGPAASAALPAER